MVYTLGPKRVVYASIVMISSGSDLPGNGPPVHYGSSKGALNYLTKALAKELGAANGRPVLGLRVFLAMLTF